MPPPFLDWTWISGVIDHYFKAGSQYNARSCVALRCIAQFYFKHSAMQRNATIDQNSILAYALALRRNVRRKTIRLVHNMTQGLESCVASRHKDFGLSLRCVALQHVYNRTALRNATQGKTLRHIVNQPLPIKRGKLWTGRLFQFSLICWMVPFLFFHAIGE